MPKTCNVCHRSKPNTEFYDKHPTRCKVCYRAKQHAYYEGMTPKQWRAHCIVTGDLEKERRAADPKYRDKKNKVALKWYYANKHRPEVINGHRKSSSKYYYDTIKSDPVKYAAHLAQQRIYNKKYYDARKKMHSLPKRAARK